MPGQKLSTIATLLVIISANFLPIYADNSTPARQNTSVVQPFTVIDYNYGAVVKNAERDVQQLINRIKETNASQHDSNALNNLLIVASHFLTEIKHIPYAKTGAEGEGEWCSPSQHAGCNHIQQDPIFRTDSLNCATLVQLIMALIHANTLSDFTQNIIAINYGISQIAGKPATALRYYNRNNFPTADFNFINSKNHRIQDVTQQTFPSVVKVSSSIIDRANWFKHKNKPHLLGNNVRVLSINNGDAMVNRLKNNYGAFFKPQKVTIYYIPKLFFLTKQGGRYIPNETLINQIPVPSIVEIVRDDSQWKVHGKNIVDAIGSGLNVSHIALLFRQNFQPNEIIFQQTRCYYDKTQHKQCQTKPIYCHSQQPCIRTMMLAATNAFPDHYLWSFNKISHQYSCTAPNKIPAGAQALTTCNRVIVLPLSEYLTRYNYGHYTYLTEPSLLGFNFQQLLF